MVYLILLLFILFLNFHFEVRNNKYLDTFFYNLLLICFILLAGLRYRVGGDSLAYVDYFSNLPNLSELSTFNFLEQEYNPLWYVFNAIIKSIFDDFIFFQFVHASIINIVIFNFIKKNLNNKYIGILFYFLFYYLYYNMEILRESLSIILFLIAVPCLLKRKWFYYYIYATIAILIHSSAIVLFILPILIGKFNFKHFAILLLSLVVVGFFNLNLFIQSLSIFEQIDKKLFVYSDLKINIFGIISQMLIIFPVIGVYYLQIKNKLPSQKFDKFVTPYIYLGIASLLVAGFYRFLNYLNILMLIYMVDVLYNIITNNFLHYKNFILTNIVILILLFNQSYYFLRDTSEYSKNTHFYQLYFPYYSVFDKTIDIDRENLYENMMDN